MGGGTQAIRPVTRLRLESTLYQLTAVGGPRYLTRRVNSAAFVALDQLFPRGQWSRRLISWACRLLHPTEWCARPPPPPPPGLRALLKRPTGGYAAGCALLGGGCWSEHPLGGVVPRKIGHPLIIEAAVSIRVAIACEVCGTTANWPAILVRRHFDRGQFLSGMRCHEESGIHMWTCHP